MIYNSTTLTKKIAEQLIAKYGGKMQAARAIVKDCRTEDGGAMSLNAVEVMIRRASVGALKSDKPKMIYDPARLDKANQVLNLLDEANIDIDSVDKINNVKIKSGFHEGLTKDAAGNAVITKLRSKRVEILLSPKWADGPAWPVLQPGPMHKIRVEPWRAKKKTGKTIVVISDTQIGFLRDVFKPEVKAPIHDLQAIELARKIVADVQPDQLGYIGDFLDLPEMSRWLQLPEFQATTQPSIDEGCRILDLFEAAAGPREKRDPTIFIAGNHDRRLAEYGIKNAKAAHYLRPGDETPEDWREKCGIPFLLGFEKRGIEYVGEYPGGEWWITPKLVARHNPEGPHAYGDDVSVMAGHTHALEQKTYSTRTKFGRRERTYYEIACLCSLNQYADPKSLQATVVPSNRALVKNWVNGFAIVHVDDDGLFTVELVKFEKRADGTMRCKRPTGVTYEVAPDWDTSPPAVAAAA